MASAEGYLAGDSIQRFRRYLEILRNWECVGSSPTMGTSRPVALTHSPTPGSKKCGVLSKGFLASKSKPVYVPLDGFTGQRQSTASGSIPERGLKMPTSENGAVYSGWHRSCKQKEMDAQSASLVGT